MPPATWAAFQHHRCNQVSMTGFRSQRNMKRGAMPPLVCSELRLFSREAITLIDCLIRAEIIDEIQTGRR